MELIEYWKVIRKRLWLIILLMIGAGSGVYYYSQQQVPRYRATTTLFLNPGAVTPLLAFPVETSNRAQSLASTYAEFMQTQSFAQLVTKELDVPISEGEVLRSLATEYESGSQFFRIRATHTNPELAQELANTAAEVFITENAARQQQIEAQSTAAITQRQQRLNQLQDALQDELNFYNDQIQDLPSQISALQSQPQTLENEARIRSLREELANFRSLRVDVLTSLLQTQSINVTETAPNVDTAVVVDQASLPSSPLSRKTLELTLLAVVAALAVGSGLAFLLEYLDYTIKSADVLDMIYGMPTQGIIGAVVGRFRSKKPAARLVTVSAPLSPTAEAFRALRTTVQTAATKSLLITSAKPGEGKSFVAANLAVSLAKNGLQVILVDADLRKPSLHQMFELPRVPGFSNLVFRQNGEIKDFLQSTAVKNLRLLTAGTVPPNPAELLGSQRAALVMEELEQHADIVIYDSPPAVMVTDAVVLAPRVNAVLQVVHAGHTNAALVLRCKAVLEQVGARILGPVLNRVNQDELKYQTYYYDPSQYTNQKTAEAFAIRRMLPRRRRTNNGLATNVE